MYEWHKEQLTEKDKKAYEVLLKGLSKRQAVIAVPPMSAAGIDMMQKVINDHPELMDVDFRGFQIMTLFGREALHITYAEHSEEAEALLKKWEELFLEKVTDDMRSWDRAVIIYDTLGSLIKYHETDGLSEHTLKSVLLKQEAVCDGIAKMFKHMCDILELPCIVVQGTSQGNGHAWNIVSLDGEWYHVDLTADLMVAEKTGGSVSHVMFAVPDQAVEKDHQWDRTQYPACGGETTYFDHYHLTCNSFFTFAVILADMRKSERPAFNIKFDCSPRMTNHRLGVWMNFLAITGPIRSYFLEDSQIAVFLLQ